jgi:hypothetical protein
LHNVARNCLGYSLACLKNEQTKHSWATVQQQGICEQNEGAFLGEYFRRKYEVKALEEAVKLPFLPNGNFRAL